MAQKRIAAKAKADRPPRFENAVAYDAACVRYFDEGTEPASPYHGRWLDPVCYFEEVLGFTAWTHQARIARALPEHRRISVRSCHKAGKSKIAAALSLWFYDAFEGGRVILTAPTYRQVDEVLWREVLEMHRTAKHPISGTRNISPATGIRDGQNQIVGLSTDEPEKFSGWSGANVLYIVDEASGIDEAIFEAIEGNRAGGAWFAMFSNPTQLTGEFYASHTTKASFYWTAHVRAEEVAAYQEERGFELPGMAGRKWIEERAAEWGEDSPQYAIRVDGNFPTRGLNNVIPLAFVDAAYDRSPDLTARRLKIGVDVARFGDDDSVIQPVRGFAALQRVVIHGQDTMAIADACVNMVAALRRDRDDKPVINVDEIGVGAGVLDRLHRLAKKHDFIAIGINVAEASDNPDKFKNLRSQLWFSTLKWLDEGGALIHKDPKLTEELTGAMYTIDERGRFVVELKKKMKERIGRSPDRADALNLAVYGKFPTEREMRRRGGQRSKARGLGRKM